MMCNPKYSGVCNCTQKKACSCGVCKTCNKLVAEIIILGRVPLEVVTRCEEEKNEEEHDENKV
jgi:hypothetical protein